MFIANQFNGWSEANLNPKKCQVINEQVTKQHISKKHKWKIMLISTQKWIFVFFKWKKHSEVIKMGQITNVSVVHNHLLY